MILIIELSVSFGTTLVLLEVKLTSILYAVFVAPVVLINHFIVQVSSLVIEPQVFGLGGSPTVIGSVESVSLISPVELTDSTVTLMTSEPL